jgi:hypothetical protein
MQDNVPYNIMLLNTQEKLLRNKILGWIFLAMTSLLGLGGMDAQTNLVLPTTSNHYQDSYQLPDGTIRIVSNESGNYQGLFFVDRLPGGLITDPVFYPSSIDDQYFNFAGILCDVLPLKDGNAILGINQIDCDYSPPPGVCLSAINGEVPWGIWLVEYNLGSFIERIVLVDSQVFSVTNGQETIYFDMQGNPVVPQPQFIIYDEVVNTEDGYLASLGPQLFLLDDHFDKVDSISLDTTILNVLPVADTAILISTLHTIFLLRKDLTEIAQTKSFNHINLAATSSGLIWLSRIDGKSLYVLNETLSPQDSFTIHEDIYLKNIFEFNDTIIVTGDYVRAGGVVTFFHSAAADAFSFEVVKDIQIDSISLVDEVYYSPEPFSFGGLNIGYENVVVHVSNTGSDTIQQVIIQYREGTGCGMCDSERRQWTFDSLMLLPGMNRQLPVGHISVWCVQTDINKLCLKAAPADDLPETDQDNNNFCEEVNAILVNLEDPTRSELKVFPNPADDVLTISLDEESGADHHGVIINGNGGPVERFRILENSTEISLVDYPSGIYFLTIMKSQGVYLSEKFSVIH